MLESANSRAMLLSDIDHHNRSWGWRQLSTEHHPFHVYKLNGAHLEQCVFHVTTGNQAVMPGLSIDHILRLIAMLFSHFSAAGVIVPPRPRAVIGSTIVRHAQDVVNTDAAPRDRLPTKPRQIHEKTQFEGQSLANG